VSANAAARKNQDPNQMRESHAPPGMTTDESHLAQAIDTEHDIIGAVKHEPLVTPAPTISTLTEHGELASPYDSVSQTVRAKSGTNFQLPHTLLPHRAQSYVLRSAFQTPQRSSSPIQPMLKHETIVIDDDDEETTQATSYGQRQAHSTSLFARTQTPQSTMQEQFVQPQAISREAQIRQLRRLRKQTQLELRNLEIEKRLEALGGFDES
jgi:hypothetical protein